MREFLGRCLQKPVRDLVRGPDGSAGLTDEMLGAFPDGAQSETLLPKFQTPGCLELLGAGGGGRFTAVVPGWPFRDAPPRQLFRKIV